MIDGLRPYTAYKDAGVAWLRELPEHWEVRRNGRLFVQRNENGFADLPILEVSLKTGVRIRDLESSNRKQVMSEKDKYKRAQHGDIAYNMMRMWQGAVGVAPVDGLVSPAYVVARPLPGTESRYFEYQFRIGDYMIEVNKFSRGIVSDRNRLYWEDFKQMPSLFPPTEEQTAIVSFLDHADRVIRKYIWAKQKLIKLLEEQKQAIIHHAVTRGLEPNVRMKPSGVEWLGDVPEHWEVLPLRRRWSVTDCKHLTVPFVENGIPLASVREVQSFELSLEKAKRTTEEWYKSLIEGDRRPEKGDLVYCRNVSVGAAAYVGIDEPFAMGQDVCLIRSKDQNQRYLNYYLRSPAMRRQLALLQIGSTFNRINVADIKALTIVIPPREEQNAIVHWLDERLKAASDVTESIRQEITLLREYRTRLIADVVTGKLDVRGWTPPANAGEAEDDAEIDGAEEFEDLSDDEEAELMGAAAETD